MKAPRFWAEDGVPARLLAPLGFAIAGAGALQRRLTRPIHASVPVICVGNLTAGGTGKTPTALALAEIARTAGHSPAFLSRGYGGRLAGPVLVDPATHDAGEVGDEPLLLARAAPTIVCRDRVVGAAAAIDIGASLLILDDGFQTPRLVYDRALVVIDGGVGWGNGRLLPAGPLREPVAEGLARADAVILVGPDRAGILPLPASCPVVTARLVPVPMDLGDQPLIAFAGIGRPSKVFETLQEMGANLVGTHSFADHHRYSGADLDRLLAEARQVQARLITTQKDRVRLPPAVAAEVLEVAVRLVFDDPAAAAQLIPGRAPCTG
ncbi:MAG: tetraacyldisaccharide 4'-kinase [Alphaproteobacteria bacterium]|nr:MAG: tetraacyldisaccharide 4'-kinase [Alphaproteobacteria bacterium]